MQLSEKRTIQAGGPAASPECSAAQKCNEATVHAGEGAKDKAVGGKLRQVPRRQVM